MSSFQSVLKSFNVNEKFTKEPRKPKYFNAVKNNIPLKENYNQMADLVFFPETPTKFKYLLVVVDIASNKFDIEPLKDKTPQNVLSAIKVIYRRKYVKTPYGSLATDSGTEFKGVFHKWLFDESILHKQALPHRHSQLSNINNLSKQLGRIINGYLNYLEEKSGKTEKDWLPILPKLRKELNKFRELDLSKLKYPNNDVFHNPQFKSKYDIGDIVYYKLDYPENALGNKQNTATFRSGDYRYSRVPKKIVKVLLMNDKPYYRYLLEGIDNASYTEQQLIKAGKEETATKYKVKQIVGDKIMNSKKYYKVWFVGYLKKDATWEPADQLIKDGLKPLIDEYNRNN